MKTIFDKNTRDELISRINTLNENSRAQWGKMTAAQMIKHCSICEAYYYGNVAVKRSFLGRIIGRIAIKAILKDDTSSLKKNAPTLPAFRIIDTGLDFEKEKINWIHFIERYETFKSSSFTHWFFGAMTREQLGQFIYKHTDHHLKQFGV